MDFGALQFEFGSTVNRASSSSGNRIGKVESVDSGSYTVVYSNGSRSRGVVSQTVQSWKSGDWVTVETASGKLVIVGIAVGAAGA